MERKKKNEIAENKSHIQCRRLFHTLHSMVEGSAHGRDHGGAETGHTGRWGVCPSVHNTAVIHNVKEQVGDFYDEETPAVQNVNALLSANFPKIFCVPLRACSIHQIFYLKLAQPNICIVIQCTCKAKTTLPSGGPLGASVG